MKPVVHEVNNTKAFRKATTSNVPGKAKFGCLAYLVLIALFISVLATG